MNIFKICTLAISISLILLFSGCQESEETKSPSTESPDGSSGTDVSLGDLDSVDEDKSSAMSLNYIRTEAGVNRHGKYRELWALAVASKYQQVVTDRSIVTMGVMAGFAKAKDQGYLYREAGNVFYGTDEKKLGTLDPSDNTFTYDESDVFKNVSRDKINNDETNNDYLVTFGLDYSYDASGRWDILTLDDNFITLKDDYLGKLTENLGFAIGRNHRDETCSTSGDKARAVVYPEDINGSDYILDENGKMIIIIEYDPYLVGKTVMLWANINGIDYGTGDRRLGRAKKITLRGHGLEATKARLDSDGEATIFVSLKNSPNFYRDADFHYDVDVGTSANYEVLNDSNDIQGCKTGKIKVKVTAVEIDGKKGTLPETVTLTNLFVKDEF